MIMVTSTSFRGLSKDVAEFFVFAGRLAQSRGTRAYVVGGFVRDLFLGVPNDDVDLVVETDGIAFAEALAKKFSLHVVSHRRFGTATLTGLHGFKVDVASARKETYEKPAALPDVAAGSIQDDLFRRDFTINAMAIALEEGGFGKVIDTYAGQDDLKKRLVRALHPSSFIDDPTRILRAVRFEQRYDFKIERETLRWIAQAARRKMLNVVGKHRLRDELVLIFREKHPQKTLKRLDALCGFSYISPALRYRRAWGRLFEGCAKKGDWFRDHFAHRRRIEPDAMYLALFFYSLPLQELKKAMFDFAFLKSASSCVLSLKENFPRIEKELSRRDVRPSVVYRLLEPLRYEVILCAMVLSGNKRVGGRIEDFFLKYNGQRLGVKGEDLVRLGVKPGPQFKKILGDLLDAKIDGKARDKSEEGVLAQKIIHAQERR
jgi:tRNA nucleotidyltransferase (CCA-adding enzyme)